METRQLTRLFAEVSPNVQVYSLPRRSASVINLARAKPVVTAKR